MTTMMRGVSLGSMPLPQKVALSGFLILALLQVAVVSVGMALLHSGTGTQSMTDHYRGNADDPAVAVENLKSEKSLVEIMALTHFHLAVMPLFALVLCHLLAMSRRLGDPAKLAVIIVGYSAVVVEISVPWLALYASSLVWLRHLSRAGLMLMTLVGTIIPLLEMWRPDRGRSAPQA